MSPSLSVVIASGAGPQYLFRCLDSVVEQARAKDVPVIVVDRCGGDLRQRVQRDYPHVTLVAADFERRPSVPELRHIGLKRVSTDVVCVIEEHCAASSDWLEKIELSWQPGDAAIGGPVADSAFRHPRDWAIYFSEFHNYMPPWIAGERTKLNGVNIAYSRELLLACGDALESGYWEVAVHPRLSRSERL